MLLAATVAVALAAPIKVELRRAGDLWTLLRDGKPYLVKGVGGTFRPDLARTCGANSLRTWGADNLGRDLDLAEKHGLTVAAGVWLGHKEYFDYSDAAKVKAQQEGVRRVIEAHRNHPALLVWGLGNEMERDNDTPELWKAVDDMAAMAKSLDPNHPTMTVVSEVSAEKIRNIQRYAPNIDILGINSYGGLASLPNRLRAFGWTKPWIVTEFGPLGPWEMPKTPWGAAIEQTSSEKADFYLQNYRSAIEPSLGSCLGSYAFLWGEKQETTPTWFGMFLQSGEALETVDAMALVWSGRMPEQRAPRLRSFDVAPAGRELAPGETFAARAFASDPNGDPLQYRWVLKREVTDTRFAGEGEKRPEVVREFSSAAVPSYEFPAPAEPGAYRIYVYVTDGTGRAATANAPFLVRKS
ncbi:MAG: hypothetical protein KIS66_01590 [Fimbriimonadaceae bacterium]|nr:hypothetical protein [Fimbriimonadaceae bacterium]